MSDIDERTAGQDDPIDGITRRQFLEVLAASFAALSAGGCKVRLPTEKIVSRLIQPEEFVPGQATWYASTCSGCSAACGALIKTVDGRPIKLEGNPDHPLSRGGLCARGQATVLDLYDSERLRRPSINGAAASWEQLDAAAAAGLRKSGAVRLLSRTLTSPSLLEAVERFKRRFPGARHVVYDSVSHSAILEAHRRTHGRALLPHYQFDRARVIVSFNADFLGTWISPVEFMKDWAANRNPDLELDLMSWHAQFEPRLSLSGANADLRVPLKPSQELSTVCALGRLVAQRVGWSGPLPEPSAASEANPTMLYQTADMLASAGKTSLVISGSQDPAVQVLVNWINAMLGGYGSTLDIDRPSRQAGGENLEMARLIAEMESGKVSTLICLDANPCYDHAQAADFSRALANVGLRIALADRLDETASRCGLIGPLAHPLESWSDAEPVSGVFSLNQPVLAPLFESQPALEALLRWAGEPKAAHEFIQGHWRAHVFPLQKEKSFSTFWEEALRVGAVKTASRPLPVGRFHPESLSGLKPSRAPARPGAFELAAYAGVALGDGRQANNPWLQELPDPVTRVSWGNCASFSPQDAERLGVNEGRVVRLSARGIQLELPAHIQPGQPAGVIASALGYGRKDAGKIAANYPLVKMLPIERDLLAGADLYSLLGEDSVSVEVTERVSPLAKVQTYDFLTDPILGQKRPFLRETVLQDYAKDPRSGNEAEPEKEKGLWPLHEYKGHKWGMAIDLNSCTGCSACVVACQVENNIPVVGKAEVRKGRDMAWLRIDRYYSGSPDATPASPDVAFQPMLCQHCDNAPCETVCPVLATVHSTEGLNMQVYNRCVGTRYCANNCPYKVRRFNWFDYAHQDLVQNLALNPDVTVRTRGVMEKCTFCTQRIYGAKFQSKQEGKPLEDGDVKPACAQSCPAEAIVFGDLNDPQSRVARIARGNRSYRVLEELGVGPSVFYRVKVRNKQV